MQLGFSAAMAPSEVRKAPAESLRKGASRRPSPGKALRQASASSERGGESQLTRKTLMRRRSTLWSQVTFRGRAGTCGELAKGFVSLPKARRQASASPPAIPSWNVDPPLRRVEANFFGSCFFQSRSAVRPSVDVDMAGKMDKSRYTSRVTTRF